MNIYLVSHLQQIRYYVLIDKMCL